MADRPGPPRASRAGQNLAAVAVLVALAAGLLLWQQPWSTEDGGTARSSFPADPQATLVAQLRDLSAADSAAAFRAAAGDSPAARTLADRVWSAREVLDVEDVALRRISGATAPDAADGSTSAVVEVRWAYGPGSPLAGGPPASSRLTLRLDPDPVGGFAVRAVEPGDDPVPPWWAGSVDIVREGATTVLTIDGGGVPEVARRAAAARAAVGRLVPVTAPLVVVDPADVADVAALLGRPTADLDPIAAVSTSLPGTGPLVVLNPGPFATGDDRAAQIVLTHEATHVLTGAVGSGAEVWVLEGFADFVALHDDTADLAVSAGQALAEVRAAGPPAALPTADDFAAGDRLGAVYERSWLVFRMLAADVGDARVVAFAEAVRGGAPLEDAAAAHLGTDVAGLTARWRDYLARSALT